MQKNLFELFALTGGEDAKTLGVSHPVKLPLTILDLVSSCHIFLSISIFMCFTLTTILVTKSRLVDLIIFLNLTRTREFSWI